MKNGLPSLKMSDYTYDLPEQRIAMFPAEPRDSSRLLIFQNQTIRDAVFTDLPDALPEGSLLIFNDSKVIPARLICRKDQARIEVFLLKPLKSDWTEWHCLVGNRRKFKDGDTLELGIPDGNNTQLRISWLNREENAIRLEASAGNTIPELLEKLGKVPLPPYIHRDVNAEDKHWYQTVFAANPGAVAAPTASLHFTDELLQRLRDRGFGMTKLTLHVGAGTFKPVTAETSDQHDIHTERFEVTSEVIQSLLDSTGPVVASGTTALRALESLYYLGTGILVGKADPEYIEPRVGYNPDRNKWPLEQALQAAKSYVDSKGGFLAGESAIYIMPGYKFKTVSALITNFHQPGSTLLLLVSAFIGDNWKGIYAHALKNDYRFLSYGDASLLFLQDVNTK